MVWNKGEDSKDSKDRKKWKKVRTFGINKAEYLGKRNWATGNYSGLYYWVADNLSEMWKIVNEEISGVGENT